MAGPMLAIESGERRTNPNLATFGVLSAAAALLVVFGGLLAAWLSLRQGSAAWPPKGATIENYYGTTFTVTLGLAVLAAEWFRYAVRRSDRAQGLAAGAVVVVLGLGFENLLAFVLHGAHFGPATHAYGELYFAFHILMGASVVAGLVIAVTAVVRFAGEQVTAAEPALADSLAWFWWTLLAAWLVTYAAVYVVK